MNNLRKIVTERPMTSARAFHILTVWMKKDLWYEIFLHFLGTKRVTFVMLLDLVALERTRLVGITVGSTLTSSVTDLKKKTISGSILMPVRHREKVPFDQSVFIGFRAEERQVKDVFCIPALNLFCLTDQFFRLGRPHLGGVAKTRPD